MNIKSKTLVIDAVINYLLGILLLFFPFTAEPLGIPLVENFFYPSILGGVLFGIGIALTIESLRRGDAMAGLGLGGAIAINLSGGVVLLSWLIFGSLSIPLKGSIILWILAVILVLISSFELIIDIRKKV